MTVSIYGLLTRRVVPNLPSVVPEDLCLLRPRSSSEMSLEVGVLGALRLWRREVVVSKPIVLRATIPGPRSGLGTPQKLT